MALDEGSGVVSDRPPSFANNGLLGGAEGSPLRHPSIRGYQTDQDSSSLLQLYRAFWPMISMVITTH